MNTVLKNNKKPQTFLIPPKKGFDGKKTNLELNKLALYLLYTIIFLTIENVVYGHLIHSFDINLCIPDRCTDISSDIINHHLLM